MVLSQKQEKRRGRKSDGISQFFQIGAKKEEQQRACGTEQSLKAIKMSSRAEEDESLVLLGGNRIHITEEKSASGSVLRQNNEPKRVPYEWDSLLEHSILEPRCICSATNTSIQPFGLSWDKDDEINDDGDESFLLHGFPEKKSQSVLSDIKKKPFPLGRSTNLNFYEDDNHVFEEAEERDEEPTKRDPPPCIEMSAAVVEGAKENSGCGGKLLNAETKKVAPRKENQAEESKIGIFTNTPSVSALVPTERDPPSGSETDEGAKESSGCDEEVASAGKEKHAPRKKNPVAKSKVGTNAKAVDTPSVSASLLLEKLLLSSTSSDIEESKGLTPQATKERKPKKGKGRKKSDKSPMLLDRMNNLHSVLKKLKKERKEKMKKKQSFNIGEHISKDPHLNEEMHRIYSTLKDVLRVQSRSAFQEDDESLDGSENFLEVQEEDNDYEPDAIDNIIDTFAKFLSPVSNFFGWTSSKADEGQNSINKKKKARRHQAKIDGIWKKCKVPCVQPDTELPRPGISFSYSLDEEEEGEPKRDLLDYIAKELEGIGVPIDTSHSSFSADEGATEDETEDDLTNFMVVSPSRHANGA